MRLNSTVVKRDQEPREGSCPEMKKFEFTIVVSGLDHEADDFADRFFEAGCDDATIAVSRGEILLHFTREAKDLNQAIDSAIADVRTAVAKVDRLEPDYLTFRLNQEGR